jgi:hypothetical protein
MWFVWNAGKQQLSPYTIVTDWFGIAGFREFTARYGLSPYIKTDTLCLYTFKLRQFNSFNMLLR